MRLPLSSNITSKTSWYSPSVLRRGLNGHILAVGVLVAGFGKFGLFGGKFLDDVFGRSAWRRDVLQRAFLSRERQRDQWQDNNGQGCQRQQHQKKPQTASQQFHLSSLSNRSEECRRDFACKHLGSAGTGFAWNDTVPRRLPSSPSPLSEVGGECAAVLPLNWMRGMEMGCRGVGALRVCPRREDVKLPCQKRRCHPEQSEGPMQLAGSAGAAGKLHRSFGGQNPPASG